MQLEQVKRKIPPVLFSWDTYTVSREGQSVVMPRFSICYCCCKNSVITSLPSPAVMRCGMSCSLFEVVDGKGKPASGSVAALINKLERDRMVSGPGHQRVSGIDRSLHSTH